MSRRTNTVVPVEAVADHPAAQAWAGVQGSSVTVTSMECLVEEAASRVYRLSTDSRRQPIVIAKWRDHDFSFERRIQKDILPSVGLPSLEVYGEVADPTRHSFWIFFEDGGDENLPASDETASLAGRWLAALHQWTGWAGDAEQLPDRGPDGYLQLLRASRERIVRGDELWVSDTTRPLLGDMLRQLDQLERQWDRIESVCALAPRTLVHGDLADKNARLRVRSTGRELVVFDWEMAGIGLPCVDLAQATLGSLSPSLNRYHRDVRHMWPGVSLDCVKRWAAIGRVFRLLAELDWETQKCIIWDDYPPLLAVALNAAGLRG